MTPTAGAKSVIRVDGALNAKRRLGLITPRERSQQEVRSASRAVDLDPGSLCARQGGHLGIFIGEVSARTGIRPSAIRYYESVGLLPVPQRRGQRRVYDESVMHWLASLSLARSAGFTIGEIQRLIHGFEHHTPPVRRWRSLAEEKIAEVRERIARERACLLLLERLRDCECPSLDQCPGVVGGA